MSITPKEDAIFSILRVNKQPIIYKTFRFPAGEVGIKHISGDDNVKDSDNITIIGNIKKSDHILGLCMLVNKYASRVSAVDLFLPYLPYGRNDKKEDSFGFGMGMLSSILNSLKCRHIYTFTTHSNVSELLIPNLKVYEPDFLISDSEYVDLTKRQVVSVDLGSYKKLSEICTNLTLCYKSRDKETGKITDFVVGDIPNPEEGVVIIDDLCDGGATFLSCAKAIRQKYPSMPSIDLFITHGVFSKGLSELSHTFNEIYYCDTYDTFSSGPRWFDNVHVLSVVKTKLRSKSLLCTEDVLKIREAYDA
jgi:ribose-phosphate pyrophosphokinase